MYVWRACLALYILNNDNYIITLRTNTDAMFTNNTYLPHNIGHQLYFVFLVSQFSPFHFLFIQKIISKYFQANNPFHLLYN